MKKILLSLFFLSATSCIFSQTPAKENNDIHLRYYAKNCVSYSSFNAGKSAEIASVISTNKMPSNAAGYNAKGHYNIVCAIGQNIFRKTAPVVQFWQYLDGSVAGLGIQSGYTSLRTAKGNISLLNRHYLL